MGEIPFLQEQVTPKQAWGRGRRDKQLHPHYKAQLSGGLILAFGHQNLQTLTVLWHKSSRIWGRGYIFIIPGTKNNKTKIPLYNSLRKIFSKKPGQIACIRSISGAPWTTEDKICILNFSIFTLWSNWTNPRDFSAATPSRLEQRPVPTQQADSSCAQDEACAHQFAL